FPDRPIPPPDLDGLSAEAAERAAVAYAQRMPGAIPLPLDAGDFCLYRSTLWHLGNYVPYCRRATLHDFIDTPDYLARRNRMREDLERRKSAGHPPWEWNEA